MISWGIKMNRYSRFRFLSLSLYRPYFHLVFSFTFFLIYLFFFCFFSSPALFWIFSRSSFEQWAHTQKFMAMLFIKHKKRNNNNNKVQTVYTTAPMNIYWLVSPGAFSAILTRGIWYRSSKRNRKKTSIERAQAINRKKIWFIFLCWYAIAPQCWIFSFALYLFRVHVCAAFVSFGRCCFFYILLRNLINFCKCIH